MNPVEAEQICISAEQALRHGSARLANFPGLLRRIISERLWEKRQVPGCGIVELKDLRELITAKPRRGWGEDPSKIEAVIRDDPEVLTLWREAMTGRPHKHRDASNISITEPAHGTTRAYTLSRLQREAPELFERVKTGELTANAAAIAAGFRRKTWTAPDDPELLSQVIARRYPDWRMIKRFDWSEEDRPQWYENNLNLDLR